VARSLVTYPGPHLVSSQAGSASGFPGRGHVPAIIAVRGCWATGTLSSSSARACLLTLRRRRSLSRARDRIWQRRFHSPDACHIEAAHHAPLSGAGVVATTGPRRKLVEAVRDA